MTQEDKLLDKLQKLKRMAESAAAIGSEAEAQAFSDMLQKLLLDHDLQMTDLDFERMEAEQPIEDQWVDFSKHGVKVRRTRVAWMERLASMIARANFCRILITSGTSNFWLVGRREHRAVAEYMIVTLTRAIMDISKKEHSKYCWEVYKSDGNCAAARGFKDAFITGFLVRLFDRLEARKRTAGQSTSTALMRINKEDAAVEANIEARRESGDFRKMHSLQLTAPSNREGVRRGRAAADQVNLDGRAVENTSTVRGELS
jgi:hypothetical protein